LVVGETLLITAAQVDEIIAHSLEEAPDECCGIIAAADGRATTVERARNTFASPLRYEIHPQDQFRIMTVIEERGEELAAIYHSHTASAAIPSQTDINLAENWPDPLYVICSVADPSAPVVRAFAIRAGEVEEATLDVSS
jgi:proteasome lid subunit RPN8/RPN11